MVTHSHWRRLLKAAFLSLALFVSSSGIGQGPDGTGSQVVIVSADESDTGTPLVAEVRKKFPAAQVTSAANLRPPKRTRAIYIAVGPAALRALLSQRVEAAIVSVFTSSQAYHEILAGAGRSAAQTVTAIYPEPSPAEQLRLISAIYRRRVSVAVLATSKNEHLLPALRQSASKLDIALLVEPVAAEDTINRLLNRVANASVLLALPDTTIYTPDNIRNILITTYRRSQAVVGFSAAFVKAGALASHVSSIQDILAQLEELLEEFATSGRLPEPQFPRYFDVVVNDSVARSLDLVIDDAVKNRSRKPTGRSQ